MIRINLVDSPIDSKKIKSKLQKLFSSKGVDDREVTVSFVDEKTMINLRNKYYKKDKKIHKVFSFVESEVKNFPKSGSLGEIVVCYNLIGNEKEALELIQHSALHLLGIHHPEK